jgi:hypothetical protein
MKKEDINVKNFLFNPFDKKEFNKLRQYEEFVNIPEEYKGGSIITYIILTYDLNSDIRKEYPLRAQQRFEAARLAGFKITLNEFDRDVEEILIGANYDIDKACIKYVSLFGRSDWSILTGYYWQLDWELYYIRKGQGEKKNSDNLTVLQNNIEKCEKRLFSEEETETMRKALYDFIVKPQNVRPNPENMADMIENIKDPMTFQKELGVFPYGENCNPTVDKNYLHFKGDH